MPDSAVSLPQVFMGVARQPPIATTGGRVCELEAQGEEKREAPFDTRFADVLREQAHEQSLHNVREAVWSGQMIQLVPWPRVQAPLSRPLTIASHHA